MITDDEVMRLFERADPALLDDADPAVDGTGYLATLRTRSSNVTLIDTEPTPTRSGTRRRRVVITLAAAAVVAIVTGAILLAGRGGSGEPQIPAGTTAVPPGPEAAAAVQVAGDFMAARDTWDGDRVLALLAADAVVDDLAVTTADDYGAGADFERIMKWRFQQPQCRATAVGPPAEVTCTYLMSNALTTALGVGPYSGSSFEFVIADGQIQQVSHDFDFSRFSPETFEVFWTWLEQTHRDDVATMFDVRRDGTAFANLTPDALALFQQRVPEFEAVRTALRYIEARNDRDGATAGSLVADDALIADNRWYSSEGVDDVHLATAEYDRIGEWRYQGPRCTASVDDGSSGEVSCTYTMSNALSEAIGAGPYDGSRFDFLVADGEIQEVKHNFDFSQYAGEVFDPFIGWLEEAHPGEFEVIFSSNQGQIVGSLTPEALAVWEQRIPEFVASLGGS